MADRALQIMQAVGPAWIQDGGREGLLHQGIPPGGALVPELLAQANRAIGNRWDAPAIELYGSLDVMASGGAVRLSVGGEVHFLRAGERLQIPASGTERVRYLAAGGGFDVPIRLGARGTLPVASLGGYEGRALRGGDRLALAEDEDGPDERLPSLEPGSRLRFVPGPDSARFDPLARERLSSEPFRIDLSSNRVGTRLEGPPLPRLDSDAGISMPMVRGAIQVPAAGLPIVLGPDHPTTGGYPLIGVVIRADQGLLASLQPGTTVRFAPVEAEDARSIWREHAARWGLVPALR